MSTQTPNQDAKNKALDRAITVIGVLAILLLAGALAASYVPTVPFAVIQGVRYAGFACIALFVIGSIVQNKDFLADVAKNRTTQNGTKSLVTTVAILVIIGVLNWFGTRIHHRIDLTSNQQFSLSEQSKKIAKGLKQELKLTAFIRAGDPQGRQLKDLMAEYGYQTDKLKLEMIDPDREPGKAKLFFQSHPTASQRFNVLIIDNGTKLTEAQNVSEQDVTAAILKATQTETMSVYFLQGHGEADIDGFQQDGLSQAKQALEKQNYKVQKLSLFETKNVVPDDASVLVVAGPQKPLMPQELAALDAFVKRGGKLYAMLTAGADSGLEGLLAKYGITPQKDLVVDPRANLFGDAAAPVVQTYPSHVVTQGLRPTIYPAARSLDMAEKAPTGVTLTSLVESSDMSFGKRNLQDRSAEFNPSVDKKGPLKLAVAAVLDASASTKPTRILAVGNAQFAGNGYYTGAGNGDFFLNGVNWLAEQDNLVSIPPKTNEPKTLFLTGQQQSTIFLATVAGAPAAMLFAGGLVWWRRRRS
ncbi:GldG family protein [bacterium]|nr:GldG family protein [bacterium]